MVLGKLPVPGHPTIWITVGQGPAALAVGAGGGCMDIFTLLYPFSPLSSSLWETARYRLKYCLKGQLNPKQPTNQPVKTVQMRGTNIGFYAELTKIILNYHQILPLIYSSELSSSTAPDKMGVRG